MTVHVISIGFHQVYNAKVEAETPEQAEQKATDLIKQVSLSDALHRLDAEPCPTDNEQSPYVQHEWEE